MARAGRKDRGLVLRRNTAGDKAWYVRLYHHGKEEWFGSFAAKTAARNFYEDAKKEQRDGRFFPERYQLRQAHTLADVLDRYTGTLDGSGKVKTTIAEEKKYAAWWKAKLPGLRLSGLTAEMIDGVKRELTLAGKSPQTVVHYLKFLRHALYATIGKHKLIVNPFDAVTLPKIRPTRTRYLTPEEEQALCAQIGPAYAPWVRLAILTGLRRSEQFGLHCRDVDLDHGLVTLPHTKSGSVQHVYLNDEAQAILRGIMNRQLEAGRFGLWVFPSEQPARHMDPDNFYGRVFLPAVRTAKLDGVTWHGLRHTFASRLAMSGGNASTIAACLRHAGLDLVARYAHLSPSHLRRAVESVANYGASPKPKPDENNSGTVIEPENSGGSQVGEKTEVVESIGRGERI